MTTSTVDRRLVRASSPSLADRLRTRFAASLAERAAERRFRAQERALAGLTGAAHAEVLAAARRT